MTETPKPSGDELDEVPIEPVSRREAKQIHETSPLARELAENLDTPGDKIPGLAKLGTLAMRWVSRRIFGAEGPEEAGGGKAKNASRSTFFNIADEEANPIGDYDTVVADIRKMLVANQGGKALPMAQRLALEHPEDTKPRLLIASCFLSVGEASRAAPLLESLGAEENPLPEVFFRLGEARQALGQERQARMAFLRCLSLKPSEDVDKAAREKLGRSGLTCDRCGKNPDPSQFTEVSGRVVCATCQEGMKAEMAEQIPVGPENVSLGELRRKARKQIMVKALVYAALLLVVGVALCYFVKKDWYQKVRRSLGVVGRLMPDPNRSSSNALKGTRQVVPVAVPEEIPEETDKKGDKPADEPKTPEEKKTAPAAEAKPPAVPDAPPATPVQEKKPEVKPEAPKEAAKVSPPVIAPPTAAPENKPPAPATKKPAPAEKKGDEEGGGFII